MGIKEKLRKWCPQPKTPFSPKLRRRYTPLAVLLTATLLVVSYSIATSYPSLNSPSLPSTAIEQQIRQAILPTPVQTPTPSSQTLTSSHSPTPISTVIPTPTSSPTPIPTSTPTSNPTATSATQSPLATPFVQRDVQLEIISVNHSTSGDYLLQRLVYALIRGITVKNSGTDFATLTSVKLYYDGVLQANQEISVFVPANSTAFIDVRIAPSRVSSMGGPYFDLTVASKDGYGASTTLALCGDPLPPMRPP